MIKTKKFPLPIICVGNVNLGGTGKTPLVISMVKLLQSQSIKVFVVSRGYKGNLYGPILVDTDKHQAIEVGDEPLLIARNAPCIVGKSKNKAIEFAIKQGAQLIITDDGLQNPSFYKDLSFIVVDSKIKFGNNRIFPSGPLREHFQNAIIRANTKVILMGDGKFEYNLAPELLIKAKIIAKKIDFQHDNLIAFAGIGNPEKFFSTLIDLNYNIIKSYAFPDHYHYKQKDIEELINISYANNAILVTTEKDFTRIPTLYCQQIKFLPIDIKWDNQSQINNIFANLWQKYT